MLPDHASEATDPAELFITHLDVMRRAVVSKLDGLDDAALDSSRVPSGWTPRQLLNHLVHMEQRWFVWGFLGEQVDEPWGDHDAEGSWQVEAGMPELLERLAAGGRRTTAVLLEHPLTAISANTGRFADRDDVPTLLAICFHVLQEYARHVGHLDIVRELTDGVTGEE
jgi:uncharacterized damage-inducible protein DinB